MTIKLILLLQERIYSAPGLNPTVNKSTIEDDLKGEISLINSIAFESRQGKSMILMEEFLI